MHPGISKPDPAFETEGLIRQSSYRRHRDHVSRKVIVNGLLYIGTDLRMIPYHTTCTR